YIKNLKIIPILGSFADKELIDYVSQNRVIIATMDRELKKQIKNNGSSIMSIHNDKIILEN
ncbi:MAG: twitching motility protein PilT, partial [Candidatus Nitrosomaritimum aestuariumsis]